MRHELREAILRLSVAERLELVQEVWDSIALDCEREPYPLSEEQRRDLERRLGEADADPTGGASWQEVRERIRHGRRVSQPLTLRPRNGGADGQAFTRTSSPDRMR